MTEYNLGDRVKLTKGEEIVTGEVNAYEGVTTSLGTFSISLDFAARLGWTIEVLQPAVVLPTEHGVYRDKDGDIWVIGVDDKLRIVASGGWVLEGHSHEEDLEPYAERSVDEESENYAPFTRLYTLEEAGKILYQEHFAARSIDNVWDSVSIQSIQEKLVGHA